MNLRMLLTGLTALLCVFLAGCKYKEREIIIGYKGVARQNPFLAAERFLDELGCFVEKLNTFKKLPGTYSTLITPSQSFINFGDAELALKWVQRGGHLVVLLSGGEQWINDWGHGTILDLFKNKEHGDEEQRLLNELGVESVTPGEKAAVPVKFGRRTYDAQLAGTVKFSKAPRKFDIQGGDSLMSFRRGSGRVTLVANAHLFRNRYIGEEDHAALLYALAAIDDRTNVYFLNGIRVSFWSMLWERAWMAVIAGGALLGVWLWKNLPRFGPTLAPEDRSARDFTEHLTLSGNFLWRQREVRALLEPLQRTLLATFDRRGLRPDDADVQKDIAARTGLTEERVRLAAFVVEPETQQAFLRTVQDIQLIQSKL